VVSKSAISTVAAAAAFLATTAGAAAGVDPGAGTLMAYTDHGPRPLPLVETEAVGFISGALARVKLRHAFDNPFARPIEAIYVFPLPEDAAVHAMTVRVGDQVARGTIRRREDAARLYARARASGQLAALLEEERPNVFTQAIVNILPRTRVVVDLEYDVELAYEDGQYSFVFPMVVAPRFVPGTPDGRPLTGHGTSPNTDRVPDASRVTPPIAPEKRSGRNVSLELFLDPGGRARDIYSPSHPIATAAAAEHGPGVVRIALAERDELPNRDFVLRYRLAGDRPALSALSHRDQRGGFFTLRFEPPRRPRAGDVIARDLIFVVDTSATMRGEPLQLVREAMDHALSRLAPGDHFQIIRFADAAGALGETPVPPTPENLSRARRFLSSLAGDGGSEIAAAVRAALAAPADRDRLRIVCLITDGAVANEAEILAEIAARPAGDTRLFALGVGSSPNRYLLERMAELGRGDVHYVLPDEPPRVAVERFYQRIRAPLLTDLRIDWGGLAVTEISPRRLPDLFAGQPLSIVGRFSRSGTGTARISGRLGGREVVYRVPLRLESGGPGSETIARRWARARIRDLERRRAAGRDEVTRLGLEYQLATPFTSLIAAVDQAGVAPGSLQLVVVPVDLPAGVSREGAEIEGATEEREAPADLDKVRVRKAPVPSRQAEDAEGDVAIGAGSAAPVPSVDTAVDTADDEAYRGEMVVLEGRAMGARVLARRWRLGVDLGLGATSAAEGDDAALAGSFSLGLDRLILDRFAVGPAATLVIRGPASERLVGSFLARFARFGLLAGSLGPFSLELQLGAGIAVTAERTSLGLMGALKLRSPLPVGLQLRYDGAVRAGADDLSTITGGIEASF
jgi:Ca-activated chloride channel family protein